MSGVDMDAYRAEQERRDAEQARLRPSQYGLGELITALEAANPALTLPIGFHRPHSYRGYYEQLAFEPAENATVGDMLTAARSALGATYEGWKGGQYEMREYTECWIAYEGEGSGEMVGRWMLRLLLAQGQPE